MRRRNIYVSKSTSYASEISETQSDGVWHDFVSQNCGSFVLYVLYCQTEREREEKPKKKALIDG